MTFAIDKETPAPAPRARNAGGLKGTMSQLEPGHSISPLTNAQRIYAYKIAKDLAIKVVMRQLTAAPLTYKLWRVE